MTNSIVKHEPKAIQPSNVAEGLWIELKDKQPDDWTYNEINDHIKYSGRASPVIGAREMAEDAAWNDRPSKPSWLSAPLLWIGFFTMFVIAPVEAAVYQHWFYAFLIAVLGCVIAFLGDGCR